ncbi:MAG: signal peptidase I [Spirochaetes bacterium]|nr:signal peptidase I [Spirochaetota bacterium]
MYRYLKIENNEGLYGRFYIIHGRSVPLFYLKQLLLIVFIAYSLLFLAVTTPFFEKNSAVVYTIGILVLIFYLIRFFIHLLYYLRHRPRTLLTTVEKIIINNYHHSILIERSTIEAVIHTFTNLLLIRASGKTYVFPLLLLDKTHRWTLLSSFTDLFPKRTRLFDRILEIFHAVILALLMAVHIIQYCAQNYFIPTGSMRNTLIENDHIFAEKITHGITIPQMLGMSDSYKISWARIRSIKRRDIVIFSPPSKSQHSNEYIKRVIALPGEHFSIVNGSVYINGDKLDEPYALGQTEYIGDDSNSIDGYVPDDHVVVLGDNRADSQDSRIFGYVPINSIRARAFFLYFNSDSHYWNRISRYGFIE